MRQLSSILLAAAACAVPALAQSVGHAIPSDTPNSGTCNAIPFGSGNGSATWGSQRYQTVATAQDLGNQPNLITGLRFAPCSSGEHYSDSLRITMALVPAGLSFASGNNDFAQNLALGGASTTVVLDRQDHVWVKTADAWSSIGLDTPFVFDGVSDVLIDIVVEGQSTSDSAGQMHRDTRERLYAYGWTGAPPAIGRVGNAAAKIRVDCSCADATLFGGGCAGLEHRFGGSAAIGSTLTMNMSGGDANFPAVVNLGSLNTAPFPIALGNLGLTGCEVLCDGGVAILSTATDGSGNATIPLPIPNDASIVGTRLFSQYLHIMPSAPGSAAASNGGQIILGSGGC